MLNRKLNVGDFIYSASTLEVSDPRPSFTDDAGNKWIIVEYTHTYKNIGIIRKFQIYGIIIPTLEGSIPTEHRTWQEPITYYVTSYGHTDTEGREFPGENDPNWPHYLTDSDKSLFETYAEAEVYQNELLKFV